jgi:hypothetical protein
MPKAVKNKLLLQQYLKESPNEPMEHKRRAWQRVLIAWKKKMLEDKDLREEVQDIKKFLEV